MKLCGLHVESQLCLLLLLLSGRLLYWNRIKLLLIIKTVTFLNEPVTVTSEEMKFLEQLVMGEIKAGPPPSLVVVYFLCQQLDT